MERDVKMFVRFLKDENIYNIFQTEAVRQFVFGEYLSKTIVLENYDMYKVVRALLSYNVNPLTNMIIWRKTRQGAEFWAHKSKKIVELFGEYHF